MEAVEEERLGFVLVAMERVGLMSTSEKVWMICFRILGDGSDSPLHDDGFHCDWVGDDRNFARYRCCSEFRF